MRVVCEGGVGVCEGLLGEVERSCNCQSSQREWFCSEIGCQSDSQPKRTVR